MKSFIKKHNFFSGLRLRQILNDLKRRPEDAAKELKMPISQFNKLLNGEDPLTEKLVRQITSIWPIKLVDIINPFYDSEPSYKIMKASSSAKISRIMKKLFILLILSFFSAQGLAAGCPDGSEPVKSISADGTYFVFNCANSSSNSKPISVFNPVYYSGWKKFEGVAINGFKNHNFQFINDSSKSRRGKKFQ